MADIEKQQEQFDNLSTDQQSVSVDAEQKRTSCHHITPYLDSEAYKNIRFYEYYGKNNSIAYQYLYGPLASNVVRCLPKTVAPNSFTLCRFAISAFQFGALFLTYGTKFENEEFGMSRSFLILQAVAYLFVQVLDCMDGIQARRINNQSALGHVLDHGADGVIIGLNMLIFAKLSQAGDHSSCFNLMIPLGLASFSVFFNKLAGYYVGEHHVGTVESSILGLGSLIAMAVFGNSFWLDVVIERRALRLVELCLILFGVASLYNCLIRANQIVLLKGLSPNRFGKEFEIREFYQQVIGFALLLASCFSLIYMSSSPIANQQIRDGHLNPVWMIILMQNLMMAHLLISIAVAHVSDKKFNPFRNRLFLFFNICVIGIYISNYILKGKMNITLCAKMLFAVQIVAQSHYIYHVVNEMKRSLRIPICSVWDTIEQQKLGNQQF